MQRTCFMASACFSIFALILLTGCQTDKPATKEKTTESANHDHSHDDVLAWPKKDIEHNGFLISLGHHGNHFHGGDALEPAVAISKDGANVGDAEMTCQLMNGDTAIGEPVKMVFEPKTEEEPAHYAQGALKFPSEEKTYQIQFAITLPGTKTPWKESVDVKLGH